MEQTQKNSTKSKAERLAGCSYDLPLDDLRCIKGAGEPMFKVGHDDRRGRRYEFPCMGG